MRSKTVGFLTALLVASGAAVALAQPQFLTDAIRAQKRAANARPNDPGVHNDLGNLLALTGDMEGAEEAYRHALALAPEEADAHYNLALLLRLEGREREALRALKRAVKLDPHDAWGHYQLGVLLEERRKNSKATHHYAEAFVLDAALADFESNPQVLDSRLTTRAMMVAYRERLARVEVAPRRYAQPKRITRLLVPEARRSAGETETGEASEAPARGKGKRARRKKTGEGAGAS